MKVGEPFNPFRRFHGIFIPEAIVRMRISPRSQICYGRLLRYAGRDCRCFPAVETLAAEIGVGVRQAQNCLAELHRARLIRKTIRPGTTDFIEFLWHEAFEPKHRGVNDVSPPGMLSTSQAANESAPPGCTKVHPKRVIHHHQEENHSEESGAHARVSGPFREKPFNDGGEVVSPSPLSGPRTSFNSPEEELMAFAQGKRQPLTRAVLQGVLEALELRGVTLERFVGAIRTQFGNNIKNPAGFLLDRARKIRSLLDAAVPPAAAPKAPASEDRCESCGGARGRGLIRAAEGIVPCTTCASPGFRAEFSEKEARRRIRSAQPEKLEAPVKGGDPDGHS
jgi:Helix-turn-helix domain